MHIIVLQSINSTHLQLLPRRLNTLVYRRNAIRQILISLPRYQKTSILDHIAKLGLARELGNALHQILVAVAVTGDQLANQRDSSKAPALVDGIEQRVVDLGKLEAGEDTTWLEDAEGFLESDFLVCEVADAKGDGVQVDAVGGDHVEVLGVCLDKGEAGGARVGCLQGTLFALSEHVGVDVCDGDFGVRVVVDGRGVVEHAEGDVARAAGDVENVPALV